MNIEQLIETSFERARRQPLEARTARKLHAERSRAWVETLADGFRQWYRDDPAVRVFSKHYDGNRQEFGTNELLYDILVCRTAVVSSAVHNRPLLYFTEVLWQVESEFARDSKQALIDFNKLVAGAGKNKLFVGPRVHDIPALLEVLLPAARCCNGQVYAALVPHPADWEEPSGAVDVWRLVRKEWSRV